MKYKNYFIIAVFLSTVFANAKIPKEKKDDTCEKVPRGQSGMEPAISSDSMFSEKDLCYFRKALISNDMDYCRSIVDNVPNDKCITHFAISKSDYKICLTINNQKKIDKNHFDSDRAVCLQEYAYERSDPEACKLQFPTGNPSKDCLRVAQVKKNEHK